MLETAFVGIDLGTTNSAIARFDGTRAEVIPNARGENLTPSVVRLDAEGVPTVGRAAQRRLESDPANTRAEFKRLMGTDERLEFARAGAARSPEELSAYVLASLLDDAEATLGVRPSQAVISTPALFELPQSHATVRAGQLAGLDEVQLIQEPIASAVATGWQRDAQGLWLVFDLGGGTFDASLLETEDGWLRVLDHDGDNFLGGKDFDRKLLDWAVAELGRRGVEVPRRETPDGRRVAAALKQACESARIELSRLERTELLVPELRGVGWDGAHELDLVVTRQTFEALIEPLVERCLEVCRRLLSANQRDAEAVERVVLVGGPTLTPRVRQRVAEVFGGRVATDVDPMTVVARGAALFAGTLGLEAAAEKTSAQNPAGLPLQLEYPPATVDPEPFVVGRFPTEGANPPHTVSLQRGDGWTSAEVGVDERGTFVVQAELAAHAASRFRVIARDSRGTLVAVRGDEFQIVHGLSVADPPLARSIGVARSNDEVAVFFRKGTPLPARRSVYLTSATAVTAGSEESALSIPIVQGERHRAHNNRLIGRLRVDGRQLQRDLPRGAEVRVGLELDRSGVLRAVANIPSLELTCEEVVHILVDSTTAEGLAKKLEELEARVASIRSQLFGGGASSLLRALQGVDESLIEVRSGVELARAGDRDAAARTQRLLQEIDASLDEAEIGSEWPDIEAEADRKISWALYWLSIHGTEGEQERGERALTVANEARRATDVVALERAVGTLTSLGSIACRRDEEFPLWELQWYEEHVAEAVEPEKAVQLLAEGREAWDNGEPERARKVLRQLDRLHPGTEDERRLSFDSGVF